MEHLKFYDYMRSAMEEAALAEAEGEIPVGAVIVRDGEIIARAHNRRENENNALAHAECLAIKKAGEVLCNWRLNDCDLYVTLEPCIMCAGAIINARVRRVYFAAYDTDAGAAGGKIDVFAQFHGHKTEVYGGFMEEECKERFQGFFKKIRK